MVIFKNLTKPFYYQIFTQVYRVTRSKILINIFFRSSNGNGYFQLIEQCYFPPIKPRRDDSNFEKSNVSHLVFYIKYEVNHKSVDKSLQVQKHFQNFCAKLLLTKSLLFLGFLMIFLLCCRR